MKDVVWVVETQTMYEDCVQLIVTTLRDRALRVYEENKGDADDFVSYSIDRWENGTFVEHEQETD